MTHAELIAALDGARAALNGAHAALRQYDDELQEARKLAESHSRAREAEREEARRLRELCRNLKERVGQLEATVARFKGFLPKQEQEIERLRKQIVALELELLERPTEPEPGTKPMKIRNNAVIGEEKEAFDEVTQGEVYKLVLGWHNNAGSPGAVVLGEARKFDAAPELECQGEVLGTGARVFMSAIVTNLGSDTEPAQITIGARTVETDKALAEGALGEILYNVRIRATEDVILTVRLSVIPSAFKGAA